MLLPYFYINALYKKYSVNEVFNYHLFTITKRRNDYLLTDKENKQNMQTF